MRLAQRLLIPLLCLPIVAPSPSDAAMRRIPLANLTDNAERIVEATVTELTSRLSPELGVIVTDARLEIHEVLKGDSAATAVVTLLGGTLGLENHNFSNEPELAVGERAVFFLAPMPWGLTVAGRFQGVYRIDGEEIVHPASLARASLETFKSVVSEFVERNR